jgi:hypothetical protein
MSGTGSPDSFHQKLRAPPLNSIVTPCGFLQKASDATDVPVLIRRMADTCNIFTVLAKNETVDARKLLYQSLDRFFAKLK